jgi:O-6-methylguanine DNA methyltransferase
MAERETTETAIEAALRAYYAHDAPSAAFVRSLRRRLREQSEPLRCAAVETPYGTVFVAWRGRTVCSAALAADHEAFGALVERRCGERPVPSALPAALARQVRAALRERAAYRGPVVFPGLSPFQCTVLEVVRRIPAGQVRSYEWVARQVGRASAVRAVGTALARNPVPFLVPCHRVVRADWDLGRYSGGDEGLKARLLALEGVDLRLLEALRARGLRFCGSETTRIFCVPTCAAQRRVASSHVVRFSSAAEARAAGYRPCRLCCPA